MAGRAGLLAGDLGADHKIAEDERTRHRILEVVHREREHIGRHALAEGLLLQLGHPFRLDERHHECAVFGDRKRPERPRRDTAKERQRDLDVLFVIDGDVRKEGIPSGILFALRRLAHRDSSKRRYASTISWTILWRTTSRESRKMNDTPSMSVRISRAAFKPEYWPAGKSICVTSPVTTTFEPKPSRVRNIFICSGVVFCASSKMMNESFSVRPRMYASGDTSIVPRWMSAAILSASIMSINASYNGRMYGSIFSASVPGRYPRRSPASTAGRVRITRATSFCSSARTAI